MDFLHKLFAGKNETDYCECGPLRCPCVLYSPPLLPPPPPPASGSSVSPAVIIIIAILSSSFILVSYYAIIVKYCACWGSSPASPAQEEPDDDDSDDSVQPTNFIWYVNTVGLDESVIKSIAMCKYKKGEGLVEGTECSVCLSEFRDDEYLRLLPKCSHAFHVNCIDTWLKSHVSCPLCRARVVSDPTQANSSAIALSAGTLLANSQNGIRLTPQTVGQSSLAPEAGAPEDELRSGGGRRRLDFEALNKVSPSSRPYYGMRVLSDLAENRRLRESSVEILGGDEAQQVRRSASMDSAAGSMVCLSLSSMLPMDEERGRRASIGECSGVQKTDHLSPRYGYDQRLIKLMSKRTFGSPLFGTSLYMNRSLSSGGKLFLSKNSRSRNSSLLPL